MRPVVFAANWKMNHGPTAAHGFMRTFLEQYDRHMDRTVLFFPPALAFAAAREPAVERPDIGFGVQNIHWADHGAFTGELAAPMARDAGADYVLVGHSERRHIFGETDQQCADKCAAAERAGLTPLLCVGETLDQRERGETESVVTRQLKAGLSALTQCDITTSIIAYEPVWAIGTGRNATPDDAAQIHAVLRNALADLISDRAANVSILYGGSVTPTNVRDLLAAPNIDGVLVGGASLDPTKWLSICTA
ncbi:MAG TPA: triose-phosphate isomerase [Gemmatimonadaceae bacterium]|jgi:triosephosphate isomerase|nr:triose-phosphate isomerase [Gemmatimonadaceae bacterium]